MDAKVYELINDQINKELHSAYLYLSFADYYEEEGLSGYANYFEIQAQEERDHAMIFRNYLHENGCKVKLLAIDMPDKTFANFLEPLEAAMEHEKYVTSLINDIYTAALEAHDYRAQKFLGWFIDEQLEEEDNADKMIIKRAQVLPHALINNVQTKLGEHGEKLLEYVKWLRDRILTMRADESYQPVLHIDVYGTIGAAFGNNNYAAMADYLAELEQAAKPFHLSIEGTMDCDCDRSLQA